MKKRTVLAFGAGMVLAGVSLAVVFYEQEARRLIQEIWRLYQEREVAREFILGLGPWGPLAFIGLQVLQIVFSPIPGEATELLGGFLFGKWLGFAYSMVGLTLGSLLAFFIARSFRGLAQKILESNPWYRRLDDLLEHQGLFVCFLLFLFPGFPKDFLCYLLGLSTMPWPAFAVITFLGRIPGAFVLNLQGASVYDGNKLEMAAVFAVVLLFALPAWLKREAIYRWIERNARKAAEK